MHILICVPSTICDNWDYLVQVSCGHSGVVLKYMHVALGQVPSWFDIEATSEATSQAFLSARSEIYLRGMCMRNGGVRVDAYNSLVIPDSNGIVSLAPLQHGFAEPLNTFLRLLIPWRPGQMQSLRRQN